MSPRTTLPAKNPRTAVAGPYGHPLHPAMVTVPIGAWVSSLVFALIAQGADNPAPYAEAAFWLLVIGLVGAVLAAVFGLLDYTTIPGGTPAAATARSHLALNSAVVVIFLVDVLVRNSQGRDDVRAGALALTVIGLIVLGVSGWLGGKLSYHYGVRVADEETQATGYRSAGG